MKNPIPALIFLAFAAMACNLPTAAITPTPVPTLVGSAVPTLVPTIAPSLEEPTELQPTSMLAPTIQAGLPTVVPPTQAFVPPTLVPPRVERPIATSTPLVLNGSGLPLRGGDSSSGGVVVNPSGDGGGAPVTGAYRSRTADVGNNVLLLPDESGALPLDMDATSRGQRAIIDEGYNLFTNGAPYNNGGKHTGKQFVQARFSPDGRWLAYIVRMPDAEKLGWQPTIDDGLWVQDMANLGSPAQFIMRNLYPDRVAVDINWASDSDAMIITIRNPGGLRNVLVGKGIRANDQAPGLFTPLPVSNGTWAADGQSYVAASPTSNDPSRIMVIGRDIGKQTVVANGAELKLWMAYPIQVPDGRYLFLARPSENGTLQGPPTSMALFAKWPDKPADRVSPFLEGEVLNGEWSPARNAILVTLRVGQTIQHKVITIDGRVLDYTQAGRGSTVVHWGH